MLQMTLLLRNMTVYTRFNRFQHCAINNDEKQYIRNLIVFNIAQ